MHRIRTWAREKAHGHSPLNKSEVRRVASAPRGSPGPPAAGRHDASAAQGEQPPDGLAAPAAESEKPQPEKKPVMTRFFVTVKDILFSSWINVLLVFVPIGIAAHFAELSAGIIFAMNAIAIIPLAGLLSHATESVARRLGDTIGALMNVTFGNAVELIIFIIALVKNEIRIVQASLLGSILANLLLILGMCFLFGGLRFREQIYNSTVTQMSACLLSLSVTSLVLPTAFHASFSSADQANTDVLKVSRGTSVVLLLVYGLYLLFQLNSHAYMYESTPREVIERESVPGPAAQYFNSSSSSDSDTSSTDSSDTDSSGRSHSTAKRIKRAMRGKRSRKQSVGSSDKQTTDIPSPTTGGELTASQSNQESSTTAANADEDADDEIDGVAENKDRHSKKKKRKHHKHRRHSDQQHGQDTVTIETVGDPLNTQSDRTRRVDFALAPDVEAQTDSASRIKPSPLRMLRPNILAPSVFTSPPQNPVAGGPGTGGESRGLRRTRSLPAPHVSYRGNPGAVPPIIPVIVNSRPRTTTADGVEEEDDEPEISRTTAVLLLLTSTALVALCAEFMVDSINEVVEGGSGLSEAFIGLILLPIVGNAAEHVTAVTVAMKNKMDLAIGVAVGSSIQIAIFVTPLVVILGWIMGKDMSLYFTLFETVSLFVSAFIVNFLVLDGRSNYLEGALLCCSYVIIAVAAFFYPDADEANSLGGGTGNSTQPERMMMMARGLGQLVWLS
ncbi:Vacuolar calcium ion transporter [Pleurostoma richardsiae]|uniref:Vacuolar calcium ion transporter n=1 Tax=Pleurostoma richardsiae TaxID=41990 RepID=A0AA38R4J1_9PEZI|nr:Vacuolar calcium ion transporter [Pleurostoma richardsiae]